MVLIGPVCPRRTWCGAPDVTSQMQQWLTEVYEAIIDGFFAKGGATHDNMSPRA